MDDLLTVIVSAAVGAVVSFAGALLRGRSEIDQDLREQRETEYAKLLTLMAVVPKWPPNENLRYAHLRRLQEDLRAWYFGGGGLIMSRRTQRAYAGAQERLLELRDRTAAAGGTRVGEGDYASVQILLSAVRSEMTRDLLSRTRPIVFRR